MPGRLTKRAFARHLRSHATQAEKFMWRCLRNNRIGFKFVRQADIGPYFADFCCRSRRVVIELDGISHLVKEQSDAERDAFLLEHGYVVVRIHNAELFADPVAAVEKIRQACESRPQFRY